MLLEMIKWLQDPRSGQFCKTAKFQRVEDPVAHSPTYGGSIIAKTSFSVN